MRLHGYFRSSAAYRVRIALTLKGIAVENVPVNLLRGEQQGEEFRRLNSQGLVPVLQAAEGTITQSLAIIEWLEETHPEPALLPRDPYLRARARSFALTIACDVHPLANPRVMKKLRADFGADEGQTNAWYRHWVELGLAALETMVAPAAVDQGVCFGTAPSLADICLVPQMFNARRFACDLTAMPRLVAIDQALTRRPEFQAAAPERQADFQTP
ncbi:MAG TPA: maleylacetoacetate isomerase [Verrucomicrobiae bacterium]|jgi:maleylpyruvate isomerase|nr:maleylacetoacetate isomerase [Verrucomicrobiae bacterium]